MRAEFIKLTFYRKKHRQLYSEQNVLGDPYTYDAASPRYCMATPSTVSAPAPLAAYKMKKMKKKKNRLRNMNSTVFNTMSP